MVNFYIYYNIYIYTHTCIHIEEDKKELNGLYEIGLTDPNPWAGKGQARLVQRSIMDRHYEKLRWKSQCK